jgi:hypothetical protein
VSFDGTTPGWPEQENRVNACGIHPEGQKLRRGPSWQNFPLNDPRAVGIVRALRQNAAQSAIIQNPKTGEVIVDFVTWPADNAFVEFNIFKYSRGRRGLRAATRCGSTRTRPRSQS